MLYRDAKAVGEYLEKSEFRSVVTEFELRYMTNFPPSSDRDHRVLSSEQAAFMTFSGRPDHFLTNPLKLASRKDGPPELQFETQVSKTGLEKVLESKGADAVLARDRRVMSILPPSFKLLNSFGHYALFAKEGLVPRPRPSAKGPVDAVALSPGVRLVSHRHEGSLYPVTLVVQWSLSNLPWSSCPYKVWTKLQRQNGGGPPTVRRMRPLFCWYNLRQTETDGIVEEHLPLDLVEGMPGGSYRVSIAVTSSEGPDDHEVNWVELSPAKLVFSKRAALLEHLSGRSRDWALVLRVLASL